MAGADAVLLELLTHAQAGRTRRHDEARLPSTAQLGLDRRHDHVHVGDAAVRDPGLGAVQHPLVLRLVVDRTRPQRADVAAGVGLAHAEGAELDLLRRAVALRHPFTDLLQRAVGDDPRDRERAAEDRERDAGVTPAHLLAHDRPREPGRVGDRVGPELHRVETVPGGLLDDGPRGLLPLVPLVGDGPDDVLGEVVDPLLDLELVLVELEREIGHHGLLSLRYVQRWSGVRRSSRKLPVSNLARRSRCPGRGDARRWEGIPAGISGETGAPRRGFGVTPGRADRTGGSSAWRPGRAPCP